MQTQVQDTYTILCSIYRHPWRHTSYSQYGALISIINEGTTVFTNEPHQIEMGLKVIFDIFTFLFHIIGQRHAKRDLRTLQIV